MIREVNVVLHMVSYVPLQFSKIRGNKVTHLTITVHVIPERANKWYIIHMKFLVPKISFATSSSYSMSHMMLSTKGASKCRLTQETLVGNSTHAQNRPSFMSLFLGGHLMVSQLSI